MKAAVAGQLNPIGAYAEFEDQHWWYVARRHIMERLVRELVEPGRGNLILDVGCGPGANLAALAGDYTCVGIDDSREAIAQASSRFPGVEFVCGLAPGAIHKDAVSADLIVLMDVLEHIRDDRGFLSSLIMPAKPGAQFLITVPAEPKMWSPHDDAVGHVRRYSANHLPALWEGLPATSRLVSAFNARLYIPIRLARAASRLRGRAYGETAAEGTDLRLPAGPLNRALTCVFAGEAGALVDGLVTGRVPFRRGVSLLAVLRRTS